LLRGPDIPYETLEAKYGPDPASHFVDLPGGYHVHYQDEGGVRPIRAAGLVLLHGFGDSYTSWEGWVRELKIAQARHHGGFPRSWIDARARRHRAAPRFLGRLRR
jgi:pimeloyl-ACP methyl ester carboxylesterase